MAYIRKIDKSFVNYMTNKYEKYQVLFEYIDDYRLWLFEKFCSYDEQKYYEVLEDDIAEYSDFQTGKERNRRKSRS